MCVSRGLMSFSELTYDVLSCSLMYYVIVPSPVLWFIEKCLVIDVKVKKRRVYHLCLQTRLVYAASTENTKALGWTVKWFGDSLSKLLRQVGLKEQILLLHVFVCVCHRVSGVNGDLDCSSRTLLAECRVSTRNITA